MGWTVYNSDGQILQGSATLANDSVDSQHYAAQSIDNEHLADDAVGADELAANAVVNASVASGAAIEFSKMENLTASRLLVSDGNGDVSVSSVTTTNLTDLTDSGATTLHSHAAGGVTAVGWRVFQNGTWTHASGNHNMHWNGEDFDTHSFHSNGSSLEDTTNERILVPSGQAGIYVVTTVVNWEAVSSLTGKRNLAFQHIPSGGSALNYFGMSAAGATGEGGAGPIMTASMIFQLGVGDELRVRIYQTQGASIDITGTTSADTHFAGIKISDAP